eukprot:CAMPEP_0170261096 /NCGR_PEP_ID=MMETSP0116_2-20130129/30428_1 /TAXON_ID=400756 /ORGANISM="Durinskia baltica, Strain CSIRO CS-38" /LENGTH=206 /DNA_ID=CAMNT_0010512159 /DNA_START=376 /DNA_END=994 /DNA_ORIENTATION=-
MARGAERAGARRKQVPAAWRQGRRAPGRRRACPSAGLGGLRAAEGGAAEATDVTAGIGLGDESGGEARAPAKARGRPAVAAAACSPADTLQQLQQSNMLPQLTYICPRPPFGWSHAAKDAPSLEQPYPRPSRTSSKRQAPSCGSPHMFGPPYPSSQSQAAQTVAMARPNKAAGERPPRVDGAAHMFAFGARSAGCFSPPTKHPATE